MPPKHKRGKQKLGRKPTRKVKPKRAKPIRRKPTKPAKKPRKRPTQKPLEKPTECKQIENIFGPVQFYILDRKSDGARVVLLGEEHVNETKCPAKSRCGVPVWTYLEQLFQQYTGPEPLDFFLEVRFGEDTRWRRNYRVLDDPKTYEYNKRNLEAKREYGFIQPLFVNFYRCFQKVKEHCEFYNKRNIIRFHYSDVRAGAIHSGTSSEDQVTVKEWQRLQSVLEKDVKPADIRFNLMIIDKYEKSDWEYFFRLTKIDKQLRRIDNPTIVRAFYDMMTFHKNDMIRRDYIPLFKDIANAMLANVTNGRLPETRVGGHVFTFYRLHFEVTGHLLEPLFEIYTLARMVRLKMKRVIIYAHEGHNETAKRFLLNVLGFEVTKSIRSSTRGSNFQCISMKSVPQPWFT